MKTNVTKALLRSWHGKAGLKNLPEKYFLNNPLH